MMYKCSFEQLTQIFNKSILVSEIYVSRRNNQFLVVNNSILVDVFKMCYSISREYFAFIVSIYYVKCFSWCLSKSVIFVLVSLFVTLRASPLKTTKILDVQLDIISKQKTFFCKLHIKELVISILTV